MGLLELRFKTIGALFCNVCKGEVILDPNYLDPNYSEEIKLLILYRLINSQEYDKWLHKSINIAF